MTGQEYIEIKGGNPLSGSVCVQGSKNAILPMLAASLLPESGCSVIRNVPPLNDILVAFELMRHVGATVDYFPNEKVVCVDATHLTRADLPESLTCRLRASVLFIPPLLKRLGEGSTAQCRWLPPGGTKPELSLPGICPTGGTDRQWR